MNHEIKTPSVAAWASFALVNRAHLMTLVGALESYFQAMDTGNQFEQRITYNYLTDKFNQAREKISEGVPNE